MSVTYRFPIPREERILLLTAAICAPALVAVLVILLMNVAAASDVTLGELFDQSRALRGAFAGIVVLYVSGMYALWAFARVKNGSRLEIGESLVYSRPGAPLTGWFERAVRLEADAVDRLQIERVRRGTVERVELRLGSGRSEFAVNLGHAVEGVDGPPRSARGLLPRTQWVEQGLVRTLSEITKTEPTLL